jgi:hypothetical protein
LLPNPPYGATDDWRKSMRGRLGDGVGDDETMVSPLYVKLVRTTPPVLSAPLRRSRRELGAGDGIEGPPLSVAK